MTEDDVRQLYERMLGEAVQALRGLPVFCGRDPAFGGLSGWVFEQTVQYCIRGSLREMGIDLPIAEQVSLGGRVKVDLVVGGTAVELKTAGLFGGDYRATYSAYRAKAHERGLRFVLLTRRESYGPYRAGIADVLGAENVFVLTDPGSWQRFIDRLL